MWIQSFDQYINKGIELNFLGHTTLSINRLHSENFDELVDELKPKKIKALITYAVQKTVHIPLKSEALPVLRKDDGTILSVFSQAINVQIPGISMVIYYQHNSFCKCSYCQIISSSLCHYF